MKGKIIKFRKENVGECFGDTIEKGLFKLDFKVGIIWLKFGFLLFEVIQIKLRNEKEKIFLIFKIDKK